jgi:hypothetical protein
LRIFLAPKERTEQFSAPAASNFSANLVELSVMKKDSEDFTAEAPRAQSKEFLIKKYSDLCELCVSVVK